MGAANSKSSATESAPRTPSNHTTSTRTSVIIVDFLNRLRATVLHKFPPLVQINRHRLYAPPLAIAGEQNGVCPDPSPSASHEHPGKQHTPAGAASNALIVHRDFADFTDYDSKSCSRNRPASGTRTREYFDPRVLEKYDVRALVGKGSFSRVVRAINRCTQKDYAIKMIDTRILASKAMENELAILAKISHPCIISMIEIFHSSKRVYMVMELAAGGELYDKIIAKGSFGEAETAICIRMILDGLSYLHDVGITHRDLKPENLLFESRHPRSRLLITDFGLAHLRKPEEEHFMSTTCGTPEYIAPEVLLRVPYTNKVDCWAVGVIAYILLSGIMPFDDDNRTRLYVDIIKGRYKFYREFWSETSRDSRDFVRALLCTEPSQRLSPKEALRHTWLRSTLAKAGIHSPMKPKRSRTKSNRSDRSTCSIPRSEPGKRINLDDYELDRIQPEIKQIVSMQPGHCILDVV